MDTLTRDYRDRNLALRAQTVRDLKKLWPALDWRNMGETFPVWLTGASLLIARDRLRSAGLASRYLQAHRLQAGVPGDLNVVLAEAAPAEQVATSLRVTTLVAVKKSTMAGKTAELAMRDAFVQSSGAATRIVLNGGRETIRATTVRDSRTVGWQRVTAGGCNFCQMLAGRGDVYREETVEFDAHDWCVCSAEPVYSAKDRNVPTSDWVPPSARNNVPEQTDVDASRTTDQLRETLTALERSLAKFDSPGTRARVADLQRKIAERG